MCKFHNLLGLLFGAFLVVFTFVSWSVAKWITFAIGVLLIVHSLAIGRCWCVKESCCEEKPMKKLANKKVTKKRK